MLGALTEDQELFRDTTRKFLDATAPVSSVRALENREHSFELSWWRQGADLGWCAMLAPEEAGGGSVSGDGLLDLAITSFEMGRAVAPGPLIPVNVVVMALSRSGSSAHAHFLSQLVAGEVVASWAVQNQDGLWDGSGGSLVAREKDGDFVLDGTKTVVEAGGRSSHFLVVALTAAGMTQFLVPASVPGLQVEPVPSLDLGRRYSTVRFSGVKVGPSALVGEVGGAARPVVEQLQLANVLQMTETAGVMSAVFDLTLDYLGNRFAFGRPLHSYQALKHRVADMKMWLEASLGLAWTAAVAFSRNQADAASLVSAAKSYVGERSTDLIQDCIQLHGGIGVTWEHDLHLYLRRATGNRLLFGTPEDHRERLAEIAGL